MKIRCRSPRQSGSLPWPAPGDRVENLELRVALETLHARIPDYGLDPDRAPGLNNTAIRNVDPLPLVFTSR